MLHTDSWWVMKNCRGKILNGEQVSCIFLPTSPKVFNHCPVHLVVMHTMFTFKLYMERGLIEELLALQAINTYLSLLYKERSSSFWFTSTSLSPLMRPCGREYCFYLCIERICPGKSKDSVMSWWDLRNLEDYFQLKGVNELLCENHRGRIFAVPWALEVCLIKFCTNF